MLTIDFNGKTALVTGASRGIGKAIALKLAHAGADVALNYCSDENSAKKVKEEIELLYKKRAVLVKADIRNYDEVKNMVQKTVKEFGSIDFLVNNAGVTSVTTIDDLIPEEWKRVIDVNLTGTFYCCSECIPVMKRNGGGRIVNISSAAALTGRGGGSHYAATKGGMNSFTRALARELAGHNILVNGIAPAIIETEFYYKVHSSPQERQKLLEYIPVGRIGQPDDIAGICIFLCSDFSNFISGETILADGGRTFTGSK